jgi:hypothetical protein
MNSLSPFEHWDHGFESHSRNECLCAFILCLSCPVLSCVQVAAFRRSDPPSKESYTLCIRLRNWKSGQGPKGCRVIYICVYVYIVWHVNPLFGYATEVTQLVSKHQPVNKISAQMRWRHATVLEYGSYATCRDDVWEYHVTFAFPRVT